MPRICFDFTLKGYSAIDQRDEFPTKQDYTTASRLVSELVKWIVAPSKEALMKWVAANGLAEMLDADPYPMSGHASDNYGVGDGVDYILDEEGNVVEKGQETFDMWRKQIEEGQQILAK
jgi:hypothetical protein